MTLPVFAPAPDPRTETGAYDAVDMKRLPRCRACGDIGPCDAATGWCRPCWRVLAALPVVLEERAANPVQTLTVGEHLPPMDEMTSARARREVPGLTDQTGPAGVAVDVQLAPPPPSPRYRGPKR